MGTALKSIMIVFGIILLMTACLLTFESEQNAPPRPIAPVRSSGGRETFEVHTVGTSPRVGATMLEQAIIDAFPSSRPTTMADRQNAANAADFVAATINAAGLLCARPVGAKMAATGQYGIGCVLRRDGSGRAIYLIDSATGNVDLIS